MKIKPITLLELRDAKIEELSETKLVNFGDDLIRIIRQYLLENKQLSTLKDALEQNPLPDFKITPSVSVDALQSLLYLFIFKF